MAKQNNDSKHGIYLRIINAAEQHGLDSEFDHEVGDLQDCLYECIQLLTQTQLRKFLKSIKDRELVE